MLNERNTLLEDDGIEEEILVEEECSVAQAVWGDILGNIENQTDLQNALDAKQDSLTEAQLSAVNSGITAGKVATYDGYADQIASKADQSALNAETIARGEADTALGTRIDNEALARQQADNGLQSQIDAITSKSDVVDVVANYAALQAYDTSTLGNNDVVKVLDDETHEDALTYYRWSTTTQTWSYIGQEAPYYSKGQMDVMLAEKQDKLTAGANIQIQNGTISATDTTYTAGNGLNLNGTEFSANTDVLATKADLEGYYTKPETDNLLAPKLEAEVVAELPATGTEGKLYLTPKAHTTSTATGNPIEATVTEQAGQLESFQLDGDTFQQSYEGKNLFNKNDVEVGTVMADGSFNPSYTDARTTGYAPVVPNTTYVTSGRPNGWGIQAFYTEDKTFIQRTTTTRFTTPANCYFVRLECHRLDLDTCQVEAGSTATSYEPYVGGQPSPNPDYPQQIQTVTGTQTINVHSANLFNNEPKPSASITTTDQITTAKSDRTTWWNLAYAADKLKLEYGKTYTAKIHILENAAGFESTINIWLDSTAQTVEQNILLTHASGYTTTFTYNVANPLRETRIAFGPNSSGVDMKFCIQIEEGSEASSFQLYSSTDYTLDLGSIELCKLDTYQDYIWKDGEDWKVHKETKSVALDENDGWAKREYGTNAYHTLHPDISTAQSKICIASQYFRGVSYNDRQNNQQNIIFADSTAGMAVDTRGITIRNTPWSDLSSFLSWISGKAIECLYVLLESTDTTITDQTLIAQLEAIRTASLENGANTITNTAAAPNLAGDMEIGYYGFAPRNRYDKWLWLDINNEYEQLNNPETSSTLSTLSTRTLGTTTEQPTVTRSLETETITLKKGETEPIEDKTELPTILDEEAEETETTEPEESDGTDER